MTGAITSRSPLSSDQWRTKWLVPAQDGRRAPLSADFARKIACRAVNGAPFTEMPEAFRRLQDHMLRKQGGDREMVDILSLVLHHDEDAVLCAVDLALEAGVPTKTHILNLLHRLIDRKSNDHPEVDPPDALALETAPKANVDRYDNLRQAGEKRHAS
jgi:hypothetical protein